MQTFRALRGAAFAFALLLAVPGVLFAQDDEELFGGESRPVPKDWSIKSEVKQLETSMGNFNDLIESLGRANAELSTDFELYMKNPNDEVLASRIERKMAKYAGEAVKDFDKIIGDQDVLLSNFRLLQRKLTRLSGYLDNRVDDYAIKLQDKQKEAKRFERELVDMAIQIKEADDKRERTELKAKFSKLYRRYNLKDRYVKGYSRNLKNYKNLVKNLSLLSGVFANLQGKFVDLVDNLENERNYLIDSIQLQADSVRIKQLIRVGFVSGEKAIRNVADKLLNLYSRVDGFTQVHERINSNLGKFVESQQVLTDISDKIDRIGMEGIARTNDDLQKAIEHFYEKRDTVDDESDEVDELDLVEPEEVPDISADPTAEEEEESNEDE